MRLYVVDSHYVMIDEIIARHYTLEVYVVWFAGEF